MDRCKIPLRGQSVNTDWPIVKKVGIGRNFLQRLQATQLTSDRILNVNLLNRAISLIRLFRLFPSINVSFLLTRKFSESSSKFDIRCNSGTIISSYLADTRSQNNAKHVK